MAWTKKERVMAVLNGEIPDRVPIFDYLIHDKILEHFGDKKPIRVGDKEAVVRGCAGCLDICHPMKAPYEPGEKILSDGTRWVYERWTCWWGVPDSEKSPEKALEKTLETVKKEIEEYEAFKVNQGELREYKENVKKYNTCARDMVYIHLGSECAVLPGTMEEGIYLYADYPELVERWNRAKNHMYLAKLEAYADPMDSPVMINWNDIAIKGQLIYPMHMLEDLFFPYLKQACDVVHSKGMKLLFHSDGNTNKAMDRLVECGIDGFNPLEISAGMDYADFKEKYGRKIALVGGMDAVEIMAFGNVDQVVEETKRLISIAGKDGGLIAASTSGEIDNSMPFENVMAFYETIWKYGFYSK